MALPAVNIGQVRPPGVPKVADYGGAFAKGLEAGAKAAQPLANAITEHKRKVQQKKWEDEAGPITTKMLEAEMQLAQDVGKKKNLAIDGAKNAQASEERQPGPPADGLAPGPQGPPGIGQGPPPSVDNAYAAERIPGAKPAQQPWQNRGEPGRDPFQRPGDVGGPEMTDPEAYGAMGMPGQEAQQGPPVSAQDEADVGPAVKPPEAKPTADKYQIQHMAATSRGMEDELQLHMKHFAQAQSGGNPVVKAFVEKRLDFFLEKLDRRSREDMNTQDNEVRVAIANLEEAGRADARGQERRDRVTDRRLLEEEAERERYGEARAAAVPDMQDVVDWSDFNAVAGLGTQMGIEAPVNPDGGPLSQEQTATHTKNVQGAYLDAATTMRQGAGPDGKTTMAPIPQKRKGVINPDTTQEELMKMLASGEITIEQAMSGDAKVSTRKEDQEKNRIQNKKLIRKKREYLLDRVKKLEKLVASGAANLTQKEELEALPETIEKLEEFERGISSFGERAMMRAESLARPYRETERGKAAGKSTVGEELARPIERNRPPWD